MTKKLVMVFSIIFCVLLMLLQISLACTNYFSGSWDNLDNFRVFIDPAIDYFQNVIVSSVWSWNYISRDVFFAGFSSVKDACQVRVQGMALEDSSIIAHAANYRINWLGIPVIDWSSEWDYSVVTLNLDQNINDIRSLYDISPFNQQKVVAHELGHSLGLDHPTCTQSPQAIMHPELQLGTDFNSPQSHDENTLIAKYGN